MNFIFNLGFDVGCRRRCARVSLAIRAALFIVGSAITPQIAHTNEIDFMSSHIAFAQKDLEQGEWKHALARFRWLLLEGSPDRQTEVALQNTIATITNENPLRFSLGGALLPSTNIANGSSHRFFETDFGTFRIDSAEERKSGVGLNLNASASYTMAYARGRSLVFTGFSSANLYREKDLQTGQIGISLAHEWLSSGRQTALSAGLSKAYYHRLSTRDQPDFQTKSLRFQHGQRLGGSGWITLDAQLKDQHYPDRPYSSGLQKEIYVTPKFAINPRTSVSLKTGLQSAKLGATHLSFDGHSLGLFLNRNEANGLRWGVGVETHWRDFDSRFPGLAVNRKDQVQDLSLSASHARIQWRGMTPNLKCTVRDHHSNVALYDYKSTDCAITLNHQF